MRWRRVRWYLPFAAACALVLAPRPASAQAKPEAKAAQPAAKAAQPAAKKRVNELRKQADAAIIAHRLADAVALLKQAWELDNDWDIMCQLAAVERDLGRAREAAASFVRCDRSIPDNAHAALGQITKRELEKLLPRLGMLEIKGNEPGAEVVVDGEVVATLPLELPIFLYPGEHTVLARKKGFEHDAKFVIVKPGSQIEITLRLQKEGEGSAIRAWRQDASADPKTPAAPATTAASPPASRASNTPSPVSSSAANRPIAGASVADGQVRPALLTVGIGLAAVGAALGIGGLAAGAATRGDADETFEPLRKAKGDNPCTAAVNDAACSEVYDMLDRAHVLRVMGVGGVVLFAAGGAVVGYELVRVSLSASTATPKAALRAMPGGASLALTGNF